MAHSLDRVIEATRSFNEALELDELVPRIIRKTKQLLQADGSALLLLDDATQELYFPYSAEADGGIDQRLAAMRMPLDRGLAGWVVRNGKAENVADAQADPRWYPEVDRLTGQETRSLLTAPLRTRHGIVGVIQVRSSRQSFFSGDDLEHLEALAQGIAVAVDNARLYRLARDAENSLRQQVASLHREAARTSSFRDIIGTSPAMARVFRLIEGAITAPVSVLLRGETGTGKDLIARAIHYNSARADKPFVPVNCGAISGELLESALFGHRRGSFTGALEDRKGFFEVANGGTIFLDEIGDMPAGMQVKLLRVLENGEVTPVGETTPRRVDVRIVSATNADLDRNLADGRFRQDLYFRIGTFPIPVPPLRERREDIPLLAEHFLRSICAGFGKAVAGIRRDALNLLVAFAWPGNIRELHNEIERAVVLAPAGSWITPDELADHIVHPSSSPLPTSSPPPVAAAPAAAPEDGAAMPDWLPPATPLRQARASFEARYITEVLRQQGGNISAAARVLSISRGALRDKLKEYGLR